MISDDSRENEKLFIFSCYEKMRSANDLKKDKMIQVKGRKFPIKSVDSINDEGVKNNEF